jgi:hypothetical protein
MDQPIEGLVYEKILHQDERTWFLVKLDPQANTQEQDSGAHPRTAYTFAVQPDRIA